MWLGSTRSAIPAVNYGPGDPQLAHTGTSTSPLAQIDACEQVMLGWLQPG